MPYNKAILNFNTRRTGSRKINRVMDDAGITGTMACPKGLLHAFGIHV